MIKWADVIEQAAAIVESYSTRVTLRQLFYRLVAAGVVSNNQNAYKKLSERTAVARREGRFPDLADYGRHIDRPFAFTDTDDAREWLADNYRRDRTEGQGYAVYLGVEKRTILAMLEDAFGERGLPLVALAGYASQTLVDDVVGDVSTDGRKAVLLYAGDLDPSGVDIPRDFEERTDCWDEVRRIALTMEQVRERDLPMPPGKVQDSRAAGFEAEHGELIQVELEALDPADLVGLYEDALAEFWDDDAYQRSLQQEAEDVSLLRDL